MKTHNRREWRRPGNSRRCLGEGGGEARRKETAQLGKYKKKNQGRERGLGDGGTKKDFEKKKRGGLLQAAKKHLVGKKAGSEDCTEQEQTRGTSSYYRFGIQKRGTQRK